jgi:transposase-like protein
MEADQFLPADTTLRSSKYLNNLIEQDHRNIKSRVNAMLSFNRFRNAAITISGVELMHRIRKGQFNRECAKPGEASGSVARASGRGTASCGIR